MGVLLSQHDQRWNALLNYLLSERIPRTQNYTIKALELKVSYKED